MTGSNLCRLCRVLCNDNIRLRDTNGNPNEVYDVTTRYFHPTVIIKLRNMYTLGLVIF